MLANTVMVKKANGKWRMCIDFTDLNKACPKDEFPLPRIDSLVDAAASSELMSLLDCYSGYHQIWMKKEDEPKTSFITPSGTYCYLRMPEGLKNAGGSFSKMTAKVLHSQIGRNVLTYVDDIIVKSTKQENHIADLQETFANFRQAGLKLNPEKCVFGVKKGKFLGCLVSTFDKGNRSTRILLAEGSFECSRISSKMRRLPKMCERPETTFIPNSVNTAHLAIAKMGP
jgi:hypothetical protein